MLTRTKTGKLEGVNIYWINFFFKW